MPSRLKSLELQGYKTFVAHTDFVFADTVTAIVGPNGSGKSNIADSIRWVLGEQSYSLLRGKKTEDMIFSGSELRPRANMASVTLTFDNSDGWLPIDFSEVAVTRRAYRDGENEYLLNGQRVRLRDISELLARSGLAERTYTIIGQGLVDAALALKAEERRRLFEEAAGIGLYRSRREESLRRLDTTRHNLERVHDILAELSPRLRSLERQAKRAQEYEQVRADLRLYLRDWYGFHWHQSQQELGEARETTRRYEASLERERSSYSAIEESLNSYREKLSGLRARLNTWHRQSSELHTHWEAMNRDLAVLDERTRALLERQKRNSGDLARLERELALNQERYTEVNKEAQSLIAEFEEAQAQVAGSRQKLSARQVERASVEKSAQEARQSLSSQNTRQGNLKARLAERQIHEQQQQQALQAAVHRLESTKQELKSSEAKLVSANQERHEAELARQKSEDDLQAQRQTIADTENTHRKVVDARSKLEAELARVKAQLEVLTQAENAYAGYANGTRLLLQAARDGQIKGIRGALSSFLDVSAEYETPVGAALGEYLDAVILEGKEDIETAINRLANETARSALLPLRDLIPSPITAIQLPEGCILALDVVHCSPEFQPALDILLGNTWIVHDREAAQTLIRNFRVGETKNGDLRVVTKQGDVFHVNGIVITGKDVKPGVLGRPRQRRELQSKSDLTQTRLNTVEDTLRQIDETLAKMLGLEKRLGQAASEAREKEKSAQVIHTQVDMLVEKNRRNQQFLDEQRTRLEQEITRAAEDTRRIVQELAAMDKTIQQARDLLRTRTEQLANLGLEEFQAQVAHWNTRMAVAERAVIDVKNRLGERQAACDQANRDLQTAERRSKEIDVNLESIEQEKVVLRESKAEIDQDINDLQQLIDPSEKELETIENQQEHAQVIETQARQVLSQAEHHYTQARINLAHRQETLAGLRRRIEDDFGLVAFNYADEVSGPTPLPLDGMVEQLPVLTELPLDLEENIRRQRAQLRRIGPINPEAQKEYEEVQQRYDFLTVQVADLNKAEAGIKEVIAELDLLMEREFRKTFDAVAREFRGIFGRLFGGGSARLVLTDPQDMTITGIDIEARLPGRREQGLSLLSGGERSLTASALVFSLLKVSPTPFCVFDEVDAMLDEANVGRFRELLEELSKATQFITITHNRNTVQVADVIYGITMGRDSSSQVVSLKLDEVSQIVE